VASQRERHRLRQLIATEAVRLLSEGGLASVDAARRKAAQRYGCVDPRQWPEPGEIAAAWEVNRRLFPAPGDDPLPRLRRIACDVMALFADLDPEAGDGVASGMADAHTTVSVRLYADAPEQVVFRLLDRRISWQERERRLLFGGGRREPRPAFRLLVEDVAVELVVLRPADRADPPRDPATGRPAAVLDLAELRARVAADPPQPRSASGT
jgi:hypothetical protein